MNLNSGRYSAILIIPAVDMRDGKCVRLYQGKYNQQTVFSDDPVEVALRWQSLGAQRLHLVDLDGAETGELGNLDIIRQIVTAAFIPVQVGGGIRTMEGIQKLLQIGVDRVILGTAAVEDPKLVGDAAKIYGESIAVGIDAREGKIATRGWVQQTELEVIEFARTLAQLGVKRFIYTDISRDGTLTEPNFNGIFELAHHIRLPIIAAGGVSSLNHIQLLQKLGIEGVIIGKALYTGDINLKKALERTDNEI